MSAWHTDRGLLHCQECQRQSSPTAGTVFEDSRKPLRLWFHVMWVMMAQKTGMSAKNLCDTYGFGSYQRAWGWLHKLRCVMVRTDRERLLRRVEVDEAFVGGEKEGSQGRGAEGKTAVQGGVTPSHPQAYLNEFSFRFNRRLSQNRGKLFHRLMQQAVPTRPPAGCRSLLLPLHGTGAMNKRFLLSERLVDKLLGEIADGSLEEGQRFTPRRSLESTLRVSKETLAHATATAWLRRRD